MQKLNAVFAESKWDSEKTDSLLIKIIAFFYICIINKKGTFVIASIIS